MNYVMSSILVASVAANLLVGSLISQAMVGSAKESSQQKISNAQQASEVQIASAQKKLNQVKHELIFGSVDADVQVYLEHNSNMFGNQDANIANAFKTFVANAPAQKKAEVVEIYCQRLVDRESGVYNHNANHPLAWWTSSKPNWKNFLAEKSSAEYFNTTVGFDTVSPKYGYNSSSFLAAIISLSGNNSGACDKLAKLQ